MAAEVETMFYTSNEENGRFVPWHGLGTEVAEAPNSAEALKLAGLDWEVKKIPVINGLSMGIIPDYYANTRISDNATLGIVKTKYQIVQNKEAFDFTDSLLGEGCKYETAGSLRDGKTIWLLAKMPTTQILGDDVEPFLCFTNSHDGSGGVKVCLTPTRVVCNNTLNFALSNAKRVWAARHTSSVQSKLEEARETLGLAQLYMEELNNKAEELATYKISDSELEKIENLLFAYNAEKDSKKKCTVMEDQKEAFHLCYLAPDLFDYRNTAWGVVNAMADFVDHSKPARLTENYQENNWSNIMNGHKLLDRCYDLVGSGEFSL